MDIILRIDESQTMSSAKRVYAAPPSPNEEGGDLARNSAAKFIDHYRSRCDR